jgi:hypothetical protein
MLTQAEAPSRPLEPRPNLTSTKRTVKSACHLCRLKRSPRRCSWSPRSYQLAVPQHLCICHLWPVPLLAMLGDAQPRKNYGFRNSSSGKALLIPDSALRHTELGKGCRFFGRGDRPQRSRARYRPADRYRSSRAQQGNPPSLVRAIHVKSESPSSRYRRGPL